MEIFFKKSENVFKRLLKAQNEEMHKFIMEEVLSGGEGY